MCTARLFNNILNANGIYYHISLVMFFAFYNFINDKYAHTHTDIRRHVYTLVSFYMCTHWRRDNCVNAEIL